MTKSRSRRDDPERLTLTVKEVARLLGISMSTVRRRIKDLSIPSIGGLGELQRIPRRWLDEQVGRRSGGSE
jgi:excisionase family DNA binding protein